MAGVYETQAKTQRPAWHGDRSERRPAARPTALPHALPQIMGLPTVIVVPADADKPATRTEGLLAADKIIEIVRNAAAEPATGQQRAGGNGTLHN